MTYLCYEPMRSFLFAKFLWQKLQAECVRFECKSSLSFLCSSADDGLGEAQEREDMDKNSKLLSFCPFGTNTTEDF